MKHLSARRRMSLEGSPLKERLPYMWEKSFALRISWSHIFCAIAWGDIAWTYILWTRTLKIFTRIMFCKLQLKHFEIVKFYPWENLSTCRTFHQYLYQKSITVMYSLFFSLYIYLTLHRYSSFDAHRLERCVVIIYIALES